MKSIETTKEETRADKYLKILEILSKIPEDRLERLVGFLSKLDFDEDNISEKRDTLTYDRDLRILIMGDLNMKTSEELYLTSNHTSKNPKTGEPFSVRFNDNLSPTIEEENDN
tara:strand:+ start:1340 stop:1678 length:339 start_codon:yes stop_codon:yes gene_type:complete